MCKKQIMNYSHPSVYAGGLVPGTPGIPKSMQYSIPGEPMYRKSLPSVYPSFASRNTVFSILIWLGKKFKHKWTHAIETHVVEGQLCIKFGDFMWYFRSLRVYL